MKRYITKNGQILTDEECEWIDWLRTLTLAQRAEALELLREWTKDKEPAGEERTD
jgi:hypothetical protein